jgi:hypothetical protein
MLKPAILIGMVALAHSPAQLTGLSAADCFGLLILLALCGAFQLAQSVFELAAHYR